MWNFGLYIMSYMYICVFHICICVFFVPRDTGNFLIFLSWIWRGWHFVYRYIQMYMSTYIIIFNIHIHICIRHDLHCVYRYIQIYINAYIIIFNIDMNTCIRHYLYRYIHVCMCTCTTSSSKYDLICIDVYMYACVHVQHHLQNTTLSSSLVFVCFVCVSCVNSVCHHIRYQYGVATSSRLLKIISVSCERALWKWRSSAKETYNVKEPTNRSHPILSMSRYWDDYVSSIGLFHSLIGLFHSSIGLSHILSWHMTRHQMTSVITTLRSLLIVATILRSLLIVATPYSVCKMTRVILHTHIHACMHCMHTYSVYVLWGGFA